MTTLAIDTCFGACSVAIGKGWGWDSGEMADVLAARRDERSKGHAEALFPMIEQAVEDARIASGNAAFTLAEITRLAVTHGPGTFTGVRTGVAAARGLALALSIPVVGVSSLAVVAARAREQFGPELAATPLLVAMGAGRGWLYVERFGVERFGAGWTGSGGAEAAMASGPLALEHGKAAAMVDAEGAVIAGTAAAIVAAEARASGRNVIECLDGLLPDALQLLSCGAAMGNDRNSLHPLYLRPPDVRPQADKSLPRAEYDNSRIA